MTILLEITLTRFLLEQTIIILVSYMAIYLKWYFFWNVGRLVQSGTSHINRVFLNHGGAYGHTSASQHTHFCVCCEAEGVGKWIISCMNKHDNALKTKYLQLIHAFSKVKQINYSNFCHSKINFQKTICCEIF